MIRPFLVAAALAGPALAQELPWDGTYRLSEEADCDRVGKEGGALRIGGGVLTGVESSCRMTDPVDVLDLDATLYELECTGEGQSWTERAMLMEAAEGDGIFILWRGYAFRYDRCPGPEEASAEEDAGTSGEETDAPGGEEAPEGAGDTGTSGGEDSGEGAASGSDGG